MKTILNLLAVLVSFSCFAQVDAGEVKKQCRWGFSAAYNSVGAQLDQQLINTWLFPHTNYYDNFGDKKDKSFSVSLISKFYINAELLLRMEFGVTNINFTSHFNGYRDSASTGFSPNTIMDDTLRQSIYRVAPGVQWNFLKKNALEFYCGAFLTYQHYTDLTWVQDIKSNDIAGRGTIYKSTTPGGFSSGLGSLLGFNFRLHKCISIGSEISYSLLYYKLGGIQNGEIINSFPTTPTSTIVWAVENNKSTAFQFSKIMPSFYITIRL